jgi:hypothetical protein
MERQLGRPPGELLGMLKHFNGAQLFDTGAGGELVSLFGVSENPPLPPLEWAADWYIDKFTPKWRAAGPNRQNDWAIAMMNYGDLILLDGQGMVKKWDTSQQEWSPGQLELHEWVQDLLREGKGFLNEE